MRPLFAICFPVTNGAPEILSCDALKERADVEKLVCNVAELRPLGLGHGSALGRYTRAMRGTSGAHV